jgi:chromosomal replication initiator protein
VAPLQDTKLESLVAGLRDAVGAERWRVWFDGATDFHVTDDGLLVGVANLFISDYLKSHFEQQLAEASLQAFGRALPVTYRVQPDLFQKRRAQNLAGEAEAMAKLGWTPKAAPRRPRPQAEVRPLFTLENFVVGPCNQIAYAAAASAARAPGKDFHPLFIHGGCGLGKTHLLQGIMHALRTRGNLRAEFLSAEQFTNLYVAGMRAGSLDAFRYRYRNLDVLAIDDVHFLSGKPGTQEEFLHTFNEFEGQRRLVILASDSPPREIQALQDGLASRFIAGLVVKLSPPETLTRRRILEAKAIQMGHPLAADILDLVADRVNGSVRNLEGALARLVAYATLLKQPMTPSLVREVLADFVLSGRSRAGVPQIEEAAAEMFGVTVSDLHSARKSRPISLARQVSMVLARELTDLSFADIARLMGGKNHTTVLAACKKWHRLVKSAAEINWTDRNDRRTMTAEALLAHLRERVGR